MLNLIKKIFGSDNKRELSRIGKLVISINKLEEEISSKSDLELKNEVEVIKANIRSPQELDEHLVRVLAITREISNRKLGLRPFDVQLIGAIAIHEGKIAEMKTGEGKTLVASLAVVLNSIFSSVHLITVNDYLARRDALWMSPIYISLGLKVGILNNDKSYLVKQNVTEEYILSECDGYINKMNTSHIGNAVILLGAGKLDVNDHLDPTAGIALLKKTGDYIRKGEPLLEYFCSNEGKLRKGKMYLQNAIVVDSDMPKSLSIIINK